MSYLEELLPEFRKGAKIRRKDWKKGYFVYFECCYIWNTDNELVSFSGDDLTYDSWELYQEQEPDWDYIIKNKCLCWFWCKDEEAKIVGILCKINFGSEHKFVRNFDDAKIAYINCRPVRRDEVNFYEEGKNE